MRFIKKTLLKRINVLAGIYTQMCRSRSNHTPFNDSYGLSWVHSSMGSRTRYNSTLVQKKKDLPLYLPLPTMLVERCSIMINGKILIEWDPFLDSRFFKFIEYLSFLLNKNPYWWWPEDKAQAYLRMFKEYRTEVPLRIVLVNSNDTYLCPFNTPNYSPSNITVAALARKFNNREIPLYLLHEYLETVSLNYGDRDFYELPTVEREKICNIDLAWIFTYKYQYQSLLEVLEEDIKDSEAKNLTTQFIYLLPLVEAIKKEIENIPQDPYFDSTLNGFKNKLKKQLSNLRFILEPIYNEIGSKGISFLTGYPVFFFLTVLQCIRKSINLLIPFYKNKILFLGIKIIISKITKAIKKNWPILGLMLLFPGIGVVLQIFIRSHIVYCQPHPKEESVRAVYKIAKNSIKGFMRTYVAAKVVMNPERIEARFDPSKGTSTKIGGDLIWTARKLDPYNFKRLYGRFPNLAVSEENQKFRWHRNLAKAEMAPVPKFFSLAGTQQQLTDVSLGDPGKMGQVSHEAGTGILVAERTNKGPILPGVKINGRDTDFVLDGQINEVKPGGSLVKKDSRFVRGALVRERTSTRDMNLRLVIDASDSNLHDARTLRERLIADGVNEDEVIVVHIDESQVVNHILSDVSPNAIDIQEKIDGDLGLLSKDLYEILNRDKIILDKELIKGIEQELDDFFDTVLPGSHN